jgi:hypothetical protein
VEKDKSGSNWQQPQMTKAANWRNQPNEGLSKENGEIRKKPCELKGGRK